MLHQWSITSGHWNEEKWCIFRVGAQSDNEEEGAKHEIESKRAGKVRKQYKSGEDSKPMQTEKEK